MNMLRKGQVQGVDKGDVQRAGRTGRHTVWSGSLRKIVRNNYAQFLALQFLATQPFFSPPTALPIPRGTASASAHPVNGVKHRPTTPKCHTPPQ